MSIRAGELLTAQIPKDYCNTPPTYDMTAGAVDVPVTHTLAYRDPTTGVVSTQTDPWPVYREPSRWTYADAAARTSATGFATSDIGQLAYQSDTQTYWRLQTTAPTWAQDTTGGIIVKGTMTSTVTDISTAAMPNTYKAVFTIGYQYLGKGPTWTRTAQSVGISAIDDRYPHFRHMKIHRSNAERADHGRIVDHHGGGRSSRPRHLFALEHRHRSGRQEHGHEHRASAGPGRHDRNDPGSALSGFVACSFRAWSGIRPQGSPFNSGGPRW